MAIFQGSHVIVDCVIVWTGQPEHGE